MFFSQIIKKKRTKFVKTTNIIKGKQRKHVQIVKGNKVVEVDDTKSLKFKFEGKTSRQNKWFVLDDYWLKKLQDKREIFP